MIKRTLLLSLLLAVGSLQAQDQPPPADNTPDTGSVQAPDQAPPADDASASPEAQVQTPALSTADKVILFTAGTEKESGVCIACHMPDGNTLIPTYPKLAGQHAEYLYKQMTDFRSKEDHPAVRKDVITPDTMNPMMDGKHPSMEGKPPFDDEVMKAVASFYAKQKLQPAEPADPKDPDVHKLGETIWRAGIASKGLPACAACHGPSGKGLPPQYPALAGQFPAYAESQLKAFRDNARVNDPSKMMRDIALKMTDPEIKAVADYAAGLR